MAAFNWLVGAKRLRASDVEGEWIPDGAPWRSSLRREVALCGACCSEGARRWTGKGTSFFMRSNWPFRSA